MDLKFKRILIIGPNNSFLKLLKHKLTQYYTAEVTLNDISHLPYDGEPILENGNLLRDVISQFDLLVYGHHVIQYRSKPFNRLYEHNISLVKDIVNICIENNIKGLVYLGSNEALDRNTEGFPVKEADTWQKKKYRSTYSKSRFIGEMEIWRAQAEGISTLIISHSPMFIHPLDSHTLKYLVQSALANKEYIPDSIIAYSDERSATDFIIKAINDPRCWDNKFLLADGHASIHAIANTIRKAYHKPPIVHKKLNKFRYYLSSVLNIFNNNNMPLYKAHYDMLLLDQNFNHEKAFSTGYYQPVDLNDAINYWVTGDTVLA